MYAGTPIQPLADYTRNTAAARKINDLRRQLQQLEKKVAELEKDQGCGGFNVKSSRC